MSTFDNNRYDSREIAFTEGQREMLKRVLSAVQDEVKDAAGTADMFAEYAAVAKFILRNRKIAAELHENA